MKHLTFNGVGGNGVVTCPTPSIADADITVEGSGIWQFGIKMDDSVNAYNTMLYVFDKDNPLQITKYSNYEYYAFDPKKIIYCANNYYSEYGGAKQAYFYLLYTGAGERISNDEVTIVFDFNTNDISLYWKGVFHNSYNVLSFLNGKNIQFSYSGNGVKLETIPIQFNDGSPEYPIKYPIPGIPTLYDHINTIRCYSYKDKNGFIYGYK